MPVPGLYTVHAAPTSNDERLTHWRIRVTRNEDNETIMQKDDCMSPMGGLNLAARSIVEDRMKRGEGI
jgi:hypothetical protein